MRTLWHNLPWCPSIAQDFSAISFRMTLNCVILSEAKDLSPVVAEWRTTAVFPVGKKKGYPMSTRNELLQLLSGGCEVSGESIARTLGISRNAVWKAITSLRAEGYRIEAATNRGYRLTAVPDLLSEAEIRSRLTARTIGNRIELHDTLDSTNIRAKALAASGAPEGQLIIADSQSSGRGRMGRSFFSPPHSGIYMSVILRPECSPARASLITSMTAVATARAIEAVSDVKVKIKWVNDLYLADRKICGILSEAGMNMETGRLDYVVVGIGINVYAMDFPPELKDIAASIGNETGRAPGRNILIAEIANQMELLYCRLETGDFLAESRSRSNVIGRRILVTEGEKQYPAFAEDIDDEGHLVIRTEDNIVRHLDFGEVSLKLPHNASF